MLVNIISALFCNFVIKVRFNKNKHYLFLKIHFQSILNAKDFLHPFRNNSKMGGLMSDAFMLKY